MKPLRPIALIAADHEEQFEIGPNTAHERAIENFVARVLDHAKEEYVARPFSRDILRICESAQRSAEEGRRIRLRAP